ncbi:hypothetical protein A1O1_05047 [Capronia coronata CBS 617.96]|uniref:Beta-xylosidase C-terminal Concanavalin A-like domain-containing protein n=1 Tax=Capronia coronata CBS 617.96 TaxID=1182541 RepID=W9Z0R8_9EURO|nr:uncharacterized protein A1O1_05047 [Capronia coronata CBS 617.96]EXJ88119.1 hypothetical protein A1O1_05047 [Capronia coronata CBS 617.96]
MNGFSTANIAEPSAIPTDLSSAFTLDAAPGTDIYATPLPGARHIFSAPIIHRRLSKASFQSARVTVRSKWSLQFDQGGLVFIIPSAQAPEPDSSTAQAKETHPEWVKAGIEVNDGAAYVSVVAKSRDNWCDWSLTPVPGADQVLGERSEQLEVTLYMTRSKNALMVWIVSGEKDFLVRKIPWVFLDDNSRLSMEDILVGVYAARPDPDGEATQKQDALSVSFDGFYVI